MYCIKCGEQLSQTSKFCSGCGEPISTKSNFVSSISTEVDTTNNSFENFGQKIRQKWSQSNWLLKIGYIWGFTAIAIGVIRITNGFSNNTSTFKKTDIGSAIYKCVASSGKLNVKSVEFKNVGPGVIVNLEKSNKNVQLKFTVDANINQARMIGATVEGETDLTPISLLFSLETMCGGFLASKIVPDTANAIQMLRSIH